MPRTSPSEQKKQEVVLGQYPIQADVGGSVH